MTRRFHRRYTPRPGPISRHPVPGPPGGNVPSALPRLVSPQLGATMARRNWAMAGAAAQSAVQGVAARSRLGRQLPARASLLP